MDYVRLQNSKLEELMQSKDELLEEMKGKIEGQQMKVIVFQDILTAKGQEVDEVKGSLNLCQEELESLLVQKNTIEKDLKCLTEENKHLKSEKANLVSVVEQTRENWKESEESRRDLQYTLRKRGVQVEVLEVEKRRYIDMLDAVRKEKEMLRETITKEISLQFAHHMQRLEDHLKVRDQELELLQEIVLKQMPPEVERLANGDGEIEEGRQASLIKNEKEDVKGKEYKDMSTDYDYSQSTMSNRLLGEFGESILQLYTALLGKYGKSFIYNKSIDLQEIMIEIPKLIKNSMIKIQDLIQGDQVIAIKIPRSNNIYQLILKNDTLLNTLHVYLADKDYGEVILGTVENTEYVREGKDNYGLLTMFKNDAVINTNLMNVNNLGSLPRLNL